MDFGLAKNPEEATVNLEDTFRGTPHFSSPEHILSDMDIDIRADIYSLGATLYTAATGRHPFEDSSSVAVLRMHLNETAERVGDVNPGLDPALAGLIDQCLERDRGKRPTVSELALKLDVLAAE